MKANESQIYEYITGFGAWMAHWKLWHEGKAGKPNCKLCGGRGVIYEANGTDDVNPEHCPCHKIFHVR